MKKKLIRSVGAAVMFAFAVVLIGPASPPLIAHASSGPLISIIAPATIPGASVAVSGSGFGANETVQLHFGTQSADVVADGSGAFSGAALTIPVVPAGLQFVSAFGETSGHWALAYLWVAGYAPAVSPSSWYVLPGQPIVFTGSGFAPHEPIHASYNSTIVGTTTADGTGGFTLANVSPPLSLHNTTAAFVFTGSTSTVSASATITIGQLYPTLTPSIWYATPGSTISLTGSGFAPHEDVTIAATGSTATTTADMAGNFTLGAFSLPKVANTTAHVTAAGVQSGAVATADITIASLSPWLSFNTYWAQGGSPLTIFGNGFAGNELVSIFSGSQALGTTTAGGSGNFSFAGAVPFTPAGSATITATGMSSGASGSGTLTVAPVYTSFTLGSYAVTRGTPIEFIGSGYLPSESVAITTSATGSTVVHTILANGSGAFDDSSYVLPTSTAPGPMAVTATGVHSFDSKSITLYVGQ